ncbi:MAG: hypothetical protein J0L92_03865 [Deltaproteobacteria bacterium]|nr:hypothetical protein [Deltaproteobacteria bacterium]
MRPWIPCVLAIVGALFVTSGAGAEHPRWAASAKQTSTSAGCTTRRVVPSVQIERFVEEPAQFVRRLRAAMRRGPTDVMRGGRGEVAEVRVSASACAIVLSPEAITHYTTWRRATDATGFRSALIVRRARGAPIVIEPDAQQIASGVLPIACAPTPDASLCLPDRGAIEVRRFDALGVEIDTPTGWTWSGSPTGLVLEDPSHPEVSLRLVPWRAGDAALPRDAIVLETGAFYARIREGRATTVVVELPRGEGGRLVCRASEELEDLCVSLRRIAPS